MGDSQSFWLLLFLCSCNLITRYSYNFHYYIGFCGLWNAVILLFPCMYFYVRLCFLNVYFYSNLYNTNDHT